MKQILSLCTLCLLLLVFFAPAQAQDDKKVKFPGLDKSPMDMAYFPNRVAFRAFAKTDEEKATKPMIRVTYSRPQKKGRKVFGELQKYGEVWRAGANENTEVMFFEDVKFGGETLKAGRYALFVLLGEKEWEIHLSNDLDRWGHYAFDPAKSTVAKMKVPTEKTPDTIEAFSITFKKVDNGAHMLMGWDDTMVRVPFEF